ncbi:hypothetical protein [Actinoallomurus iriomotensis]|uniref:hypothetical protein n=1 Tax=Actinoallomurus iriomotensis TaxID=478107 RepID=UPI002553D930|nr:hypothetical protein [Actinoallomurus iriomotensis]
MVLAGLAIWLLPQIRSSSASPRTGTASTSTAAGARSSRAASASDVPDRFLGTWTGYLSSPQNPGARGFFSVAIRRGRIGDIVASVRNQIANGGYCDGTAKLTSASPSQITLQTTATTGLSGCVADPAPQVYIPASATSLHLEVDGFSGDLAKT